jgi:hypothetical protein
MMTLHNIPPPRRPCCPRRSAATRAAPRATCSAATSSSSQATRYDVLELSAPFLESLYGKRQYFSGERSRKIQTHRTTRLHHRFRKRRTESVSVSGRMRTSGRAKRQCDRTHPGRAFMATACQSLGWLADGWVGWLMRPNPPTRPQPSRTSGAPSASTKTSHSRTSSSGSRCRCAHYTRALLDYVTSEV